MARRSVTPADEGCQELMTRAPRRRWVSRSSRCATAMSRTSGRTRGSGGPVFCFAGHTDVVPTGPARRVAHRPLRAQRPRRLLYGRGAADMKSGLAAMVTATEEFVAAHPAHRGTIAFLITSDEEGPSVDGTKRVVETLAARGERIDWCVVGEPSSEARHRRHHQGRPARLAVSGRLTVHGVQGHVAYPQLAENPVHTLGAGAGRAHQPRVGPGQRALPAHDASRSRTSTPAPARPNVIPGRAQGALQPALFAGADARRAQGDGRGDPAQARRALHARVVRVGRAVLHAAGHAVGRGGRRGRSRSPARGRSSPPAAAPRTGASSRRWARRWWSWAWSTPSIHKVNECVRVADIDALHRMYCQRAAKPAEPERLRVAGGWRSTPERAQRERPQISTQAGIASRGTPVDLAALAAAGQHLADHLGARA